MKLKKLFAFILIATILTSNVGAINVIVDNNVLDTDVPAQIVDGRTLVPISPIFQALGASMSWDGTTQTATGTKGDTTVSVQIGNTTAYVNGVPTELDVPARIIDGRTMVPVAFVSQSFGAKVHWNEETASVRIITKLYDVIRVIDGDTIVVDFDGAEETVRLIGVDAPESVHPIANKNTEAGKASSLYTKTYLENTKVELEFDSQERDKYGRLLAYVYTEKGVMWNAKLLMVGLASIATYPPNVKYVNEFKKIVDEMDKSLISTEYNDGAMKAPDGFFNKNYQHSNLNSAILYTDGKIIEKKKIVNAGENGNETWRYIGLETDRGVINIFNPHGISISGKLSEMADTVYDDLKVGDSVRVAFVYSGYYEDTNRPEGYYISTLKRYEEDPKENNPPETQSRTVYITRTGKKYHYNGNCNGATYYQSTLSEAKSRGLTPCSKCAK